MKKMNGPDNYRNVHETKTRESFEIKDRVNFIFKVIANCEELAEAFGNIKYGADFKQTYQAYSSSLLRLQESINTAHSGEGNRIAANINNKLTEFNFLISFRLIEYFLKNKDADIEFLKKLPEYIENIRGKNRIDTKWLRYRFVTHSLPRISRNINNLEKAVMKYSTNMKSKEFDDPEAKKYKRACEDMFGGDFEKMRKYVIIRIESHLRTDLEEFIRNILILEKAEALSDNTASL